MNPVTIHSNLAIKALQSPSLRLWYVIRGLDLNGSGRVRMAYKTTWWHYKKSLFEASENWGESLETGFFINSIGDNKQIFKWGPNLYYPLYSLTSSRRLSNKLSPST